MLESSVNIRLHVPVLSACLDVHLQASACPYLLGMCSYFNLSYMYLMAQFVEYIPAYNIILNLMFMGLISNSVFYIALSSLVVLHSFVKCLTALCEGELVWGYGSMEVWGYGSMGVYCTVFFGCVAFPCLLCHAFCNDNISLICQVIILQSVN